MFKFNKILLFQSQKDSLAIKILLKEGKKIICSERAINAEDIPRALDRIFLLSKINKYYIKKVQFQSREETSEITKNILKALTKTINFLLFVQHQRKTSIRK